MQCTHGGQVMHDLHHPHNFTQPALPPHNAGNYWTSWQPTFSNYTLHYINYPIPQGASGFLTMTGKKTILIGSSDMAAQLPPNASATFCVGACAHTCLSAVIVHCAVFEQPWQLRQRRLIGAHVLGSSNHTRTNSRCPSS